MGSSKKLLKRFRDSDVSGTSADEPDAVASSAAAEGRVGRWRTRIMQAAMIVLAGLWIYSPSYHGDWLWDDDQLLTANLTVQHRVSPDPNVPPDSLRTLAKLWFNPEGADYFPLSYTALWAQWPFFGPRSTGYHVTTILLHIAGALLVWALLAKMRIPGAWLSGLVFAIHPVCVESVAWVSETKNTLSLPLFLVSCICWVGQDEEADQAKRQRLYAGAIVFFLLAMFAKTSVVAFPVLTLLYAWWKRGTVTKQDVILALPLFAISIVLGLVTISYQWGRAIGQEKIIVGDLLSVGGFASRTAIAGMAILHYLASIVWPVNLLPIYPRWEVDPPKAWMFLAWPVIAGGVWWMWKNRDALFPAHWGRHALFAFGFFLLMVAPVLGFVTISYMRITWVADHFIYLPMISIIALLCAGAILFFERAQEASKPTFLAGGALVLAALSLLSFRDAINWMDEDHMWEHTLRHNFEAWQAHNRLGAKKFSRGDVDGAHFHFQNSTRLRPDLGETHNNLGTTLSARAQMFGQRGDQAAAKREMDAAIEQFAEACRVTPHVPAIHVNLANALAAAGRFPEAAEKYKWLLEREPGNPALINNYGVALYKQGKKDEAIVQFRKALEIAPNLKDARESLAVALGEKPDPSANQPAPPPPGGQLQLNAPPPSATLGPAALP
ncbi:MAG: tetratricopeptide repeat protein [Planctomycetia bacterium]|nr:tetratricopeptide repeat protein [Planctomycetia bacterium]